jgi:hypothetical protein
VITLTFETKQFRVRISGTTAWVESSERGRWIFAVSTLFLLLPTRYAGETGRACLLASSSILRLTAEIKVSRSADRSPRRRNRDGAHETSARVSTGQVCTETWTPGSSFQGNPATALPAFETGGGTPHHLSIGELCPLLLHGSCEAQPGDL